MEQKKRFDNLDLIKTFAILAVITLHVPLWDTDFINGGFNKFIQYAFRLICEGVPFFLTINGFLLLKKKELDIKKHINKMLRMFGVFVFWAVILTLVGFYSENPGQMISFKTIYTCLIDTQVESQYTGVLWFIQNLLGVYLIFPVLWYMYKNDFKIFKYFFIVLSFFVPFARVLELINDLCQALSHNPLYLFSGSIDFIHRFSSIGNGWYVFYFCLGGMIWHYMDKLQEYKAIVGVLFALSCPMAILFGYSLSVLNNVTYAPNYNYISPFMIIFVIGLIVLTMSYENKGRPLQKLIASVGTNTFGMYLSHYIFIFIITNRYDNQRLQYRLLAYLFVVICSYVFSIIVNKIPILKNIIKL